MLLIRSPPRRAHPPTHPLTHPLTHTHTHDPPKTNLPAAAAASCAPHMQPLKRSPCQTPVPHSFTHTHTSPPKTQSTCSQALRHVLLICSSLNAAHARPKFHTHSHTHITPENPVYLQPGAASCAPHMPPHKRSPCQTPDPHSFTHTHTHTHITPENSVYLQQPLCHVLLICSPLNTAHARPQFHTYSFTHTSPPKTQPNCSQALCHVLLIRSPPPQAHTHTPINTHTKNSKPTCSQALRHVLLIRRPPRRAHTPVRLQQGSQPSLLHTVTSGNAAAAAHTTHTVTTAPGPDTVTDTAAAAAAAAATDKGPSTSITAIGTSATGANAPDTAAVRCISSTAAMRGGAILGAMRGAIRGGAMRGGAMRGGAIRGGGAAAMSGGCVCVAVTHTAAHTTVCVWTI